jgi:hypothetical protein
MARPRIGLARGSGSARGWSHIGVIDVGLSGGGLTNGKQVVGMLRGQFIASPPSSLCILAIG